MTQKRKFLTGAGLSLLVLAACDGSDGTFGNPSFQFGEVFANAFNAGANTTPTDTLQITYLGAEGVNLTADPVDF